MSDPRDDARRSAILKSADEHARARRTSRLVAGITIAICAVGITAFAVLVALAVNGTKL